VYLVIRVKSKCKNVGFFIVKPPRTSFATASRCLDCWIVGVVLTRAVVVRVAAARAVARPVAGVVCVVLAWVEIGARRNPLLSLLELEPALGLNLVRFHGDTFLR